MGWEIYNPKLDPERIVWRRFGSAHDKPCNRPSVITCAMPECQRLNRCKELRP